MESNKDTLPLALTDQNEIRNKIYTVRGVQVMLDSDLAQLYHVETKRINEVVRRNPKRFPARYCFSLSEEDEEVHIENRGYGRACR